MGETSSRRTIQPAEFEQRLRETLIGIKAGCVTGPGRSGAITSAWASHILGVPFIPYGQKCPDKLKPVLVIDTARLTGRTVRKAAKKYGEGTKILWLYTEPPIVRFWYERIKCVSQ